MNVYYNQNLCLLKRLHFSKFFIIMTIDSVEMFNCLNDSSLY